MNNEPIQPHKSSLGMNANKVIVIIYVGMSILFWISYAKYFAWILPVLIFLVEKSSKFIKFNAVQAFFICIIRAAISILLNLLGRALTRTPAEYAAMTTDVRNRWQSAALLPGEIDIFVGIGFIVLVLYIVLRTYDYAPIGLPGIKNIASKMSKLELND